jgi:hypothetical protein
MSELRSLLSNFTWLWELEIYFMRELASAVGDKARTVMARRKKLGICISMVLRNERVR